MSAVEESVSLGELQRLCGQYEQALRASFPEEEEFPAEWERTLAEASLESPMGALRRFGALKAFTYARHQRKDRQTGREDAQHAARQLLRREPVRVELESGRVVSVTGRSYAALQEIAAHWGRIRLLSAELEHVGTRYERAVVNAELAGSQDWLRHRKNTRRLEKLYRRISSEILRHRERMYAHAFTASGAAATEEDWAPGWWTEVTPADDARLLVALHQVGTLRYAALGAPPESKPGKKRGGEDWGWEGLLASWGVRQKVSPAEMFDRDLGQVMTEMRVSAPPPIEDQES